MDGLCQHLCRLPHRHLSRLLVQLRRQHRLQHLQPCHCRYQAAHQTRMLRCSEQRLCHRPSERGESMRTHEISITRAQSHRLSHRSMPITYTNLCYKSYSQRTAHNKYTYYQAKQIGITYWKYARCSFDYGMSGMSVCARALQHSWPCNRCQASISRTINNSLVI